jgi:RNA polymerase sigma-70 factor (sigma-E family)
METTRGLENSALPAPEENRVIALFVTDYTRLVRLATLMLGDRQAAEDVTQEAFIRLDRRSHRLADVTSERAYLRQIVVNLSRSALRRRIVAMKHAPRPPADVEGADADALAHIERDQMLHALGRLPMRQRQALVLRFYEDLSEAEIAAAMGCKVGTVKATLSHAKQALARLLDEDSEVQS